MPGVTEQATTVRGEVEAVYYAGPGFSAGRLRSDEGERVPFAGKLFAREGERLILTGRWTVHPKYGRQLDVQSVEYDQTLDADGLARYLAANPAIRGIGPAKARIIADTFGADFDRAITDAPETVARAAKLSKATIIALRDEWLRTKAFNAMGTRLAAFGLTHHQVSTLLKRLGNDALSILETDPYVLVREIPGFGFRRIDKIARQTGIPKDHAGRLRAGVFHCVEEALDQGHTWTEQGDLVGQANTLLVMDALDSRERIERTVDGLLDEEVVTCFGQDGRFLLAKPTVLRMEKDLAGLLRTGEKPNAHFEGEVGSTVDRVAPMLNVEQRRAVTTALSHRITLTSGGAGSGKTFSVLAIRTICEECDLEVVLCAPTGKAAKRLEEVTDHEASTIHRLLGFNGTTYTRGPDDLIDADVLVVDEVSMVDIPLAWRLFQAIDLERTAVLLVGDHNQLPPVGPGNLLRDLIRTRVVPTVILETVVRQAGVLKENCTAVLTGEVRPTSEPIAQSRRRAWYLADQFTDPGAAHRFILELFDSRLSDLEFDLVRDVQVLTPTHRGVLGTRELNVALQRLIQRKLWGVSVDPPDPGRRPRFYRNDKVIQTRNNYDLGVMNGAIGTVLSVGRSGLSVSFDGRAVDIERGGQALRDLELAYALTIHKSQGSEFPCVIAVVHKAHSFQHHRNLLYTAVTRATTTAILVGDAWGVRNCASRQRLDERRTFLPFLIERDGRE